MSGVVLQVLEFWLALLNGPVQEVLQAPGHDAVKAVTCDCLANIGDTVFKLLPVHAHHYSLHLEHIYFYFLCPRHSKNDEGALSVTPVRACIPPSVPACVRASVRPLSKFGVCSITFERLHRFNSNLVC